MFCWLEDYPSVVVVGSGRSGTHICADMIASDLGYRYTPETDFGQNKWGRFLEWMERGQVVCQAPDLWRQIENVPDKFGIVVLTRELEDIHASWQRVPMKPPDDPAAIYEKLESLRPRPNVFWLRYENLKSHGLWLPEKVRRNRTWGWSQTRLPKGITA